MRQDMISPCNLHSPQLQASPPSRNNRLAIATLLLYFHSNDAISLSTMRLLSAALLALLLAVVVPISAVPYTTECTVPAPWKRLSNYIIELIWGRPTNTPKLRPLDGINGSNGARKVPGDVLSRYGRDIVVRFNVSSSDDAAALAEAADVLFLDVWEYADDWVDIRLGIDVVCLLTIVVRMLC